MSITWSISGRVMIARQHKHIRSQWRFSNSTWLCLLCSRHPKGIPESVCHYLHQRYTNIQVSPMIHQIPRLYPWWRGSGDGLTAGESSDGPKLQRFLGFAHFYWCVIRGLNSVAAPLTSLLKGKPKTLRWTDKATHALKPTASRSISAQPTSFTILTLHCM